MQTGLYFTWKNGSLNSNCIRILEREHIPYHYRRQDLVFGPGSNGIFYKADYCCLGHDRYEILAMKA